MAFPGVGPKLDPSLYWINGSTRSPLKKKKKKGKLEWVTNFLKKVVKFQVKSCETSTKMFLKLEQWGG